MARISETLYVDERERRDTGQCVHFAMLAEAAARDTAAPRCGSLFILLILIENASFHSFPVFT